MAGDSEKPHLSRVLRAEQEPARSVGVEDSKSLHLS